MLLGELILKFCSVGVPVLLGGSDLPASMGLISLESIPFIRMKLELILVLGKRVKIYAVLLEVLFFQVGFAVLCTDSRFLGLIYNQFPGMLVYMLICNFAMMRSFWVVTVFIIT